MPLAKGIRSPKFFGPRHSSDLLHNNTLHEILAAKDKLPNVKESCHPLLVWSMSLQRSRKLSPPVSGVCCKKMSSSFLIIGMSLIDGSFLVCRPKADASLCSIVLERSTTACSMGRLDRQTITFSFIVNGALHVLLEGIAKYGQFTKPAKHVLCSLRYVELVEWTRQDRKEVSSHSPLRQVPISHCKFHGSMNHSIRGTCPVNVSA